MNCRFFLVEGDPGSPSAFRFMMDLREEAGKDVHGSSRSPGGTVEGVFPVVTCGGALLWLHSLSCVFLFRTQHTRLMPGPAYGGHDRSGYGDRGGQLALEDVPDLLGANGDGELSRSVCERRDQQSVQAGGTHFKGIILEAGSRPSACPLRGPSAAAAGGLQVSARSGVPTPTTVGCSSV